MLHWSRQQFEQDAKCLVDALQHVKIEKDSSVSSSRRSLLQWTAETAADGTLYLVHPPVSRQDAVLAAENDDDSNDNHSNTGENEDALCDGSVLQDDPNVIASSSSTPEEGEEKTRTTATSATSISTVWYFSIVYSDTWRTPILYFTVDYNDGTPCTRSQVLELLQQLTHTNQVEDSWEFLSMEEHPISRVPSFFLHPCQTLERLQTLTASSPYTTTRTDFIEDKDTSTQQSIATAAATTNSSRHHHQLLLPSWMSMILPSVGYPVPPKQFQQLASTGNT